MRPETMAIAGIRISLRPNERFSLKDVAGFTEDFDPNAEPGTIADAEPARPEEAVAPTAEG